MVTQQPNIIRSFEQWAGDSTHMLDRTCTSFQILQSSKASSSTGSSTWEKILTHLTTNVPVLVN